MCTTSPIAGSGRVVLLGDVPALPTITFIIAHIRLLKPESGKSWFPQKV